MNILANSYLLLLVMLALGACTYDMHCSGACEIIEGANGNFQ